MTTWTTRHRQSIRKRPALPVATRVRTADEALRDGLIVERVSGEAWVHHPHRRVIDALLADGFVEEYRVTDRPDAAVYYRLTDAGRERARSTR